MAGLWCERAGVVNIGIEGMMLDVGRRRASWSTPSLGDAPGRRGAVARRSASAILTGGLVALLHALLSVTFRVDQIISGVVINLLALGVTGFLRSEVIVATGDLHRRAPPAPIALPAAVRASRSSATSCSRTSRSSSRCSSIVGLTGVVLFRTPFGLRVRSVGENPHAAETLGIDVDPDPLHAPWSSAA